MSLSAASLSCRSRQRRDTSGSCSNARMWSFLFRPIGRRASSNVISTPRRAKARTNGISGAWLPWSTVVPAQSKITKRILAAWHNTDCFQIGSEMFQRRRRQFRHLGAFVEASKRDGSLAIGILTELSRLLRGERAALQLQASQRRLREQAKVAWIGSAQKPLGGYVQTDRFRDIGAEVASEP